MTDQPPRQRRALIAQYQGRRKLLAEAAHRHLKYYEDHEGYAVSYAQYTEADARLLAQAPDYGTLTPMPQCLCEEDFLAQVLWHMISGAPQEDAP
jgi:hypothetical protein